MKKLATLAALAMFAVAPVLAPAPPASAAPGPGDDVVLLGDSYSSGNGGGDYTEETCYRSPNTFGALAAKSLGAHATNVACSGGEVKDLTNPRFLESTWLGRTFWVPLVRLSPSAPAALRQLEARSVCPAPPAKDFYYEMTVREPATFFGVRTGVVDCQLFARPQANAVSKSTDAVVLTIGGNDGGFGRISSSCIIGRMKNRCEGAVSDAQKELGTIEADLKEALREIDARATGNADIYLVGYPSLINPGSYLIPAIGSPKFDAGAALTKLQADYDATQRRVVDELNREKSSTRFHFVDVKKGWGTNSLDPKLLADNSDSWIIGPFYSWDFKEVLHPSKEGYEAMSKALLAAMK